MGNNFETAIFRNTYIATVIVFNSSEQSVIYVAGTKLIYWCLKSLQHMKFEFA